MKQQIQHAGRWGLLFVCLCICSGCTQETKEGDTSLFTFEPWIPWAALLGSVAAFLVGLAFFKISTKGGVVFTLLGLLFGGLITPGLFFDRATVNSQEFTLRTGMWFSPTVHAVKFDDVLMIHHTEELKRDGRGRMQSSFYYECHLKNNTTEKVPLGHLMRNGPAEKIGEEARKRNIQIRDKIAG